MAKRDSEGDVRGHTITTDSPPSIGNDGVPTKCLTFTVSADWGHFRRIDRTVTKQTYRIPPRTTIAGMLAAIVGVGRDGYYDVFTEESSAISIEPTTPLRTVSLPSLGLGTNPDETFDSAGGTGNKTVEAKFPDSTDNRQLHGYHYLVEPSYRVNVAVEDPEFYGTLKDRLTSGQSYYPPTLGLSELLASIEFEGEHEPASIDESGTISLDSALPDGVDAIVPEPDQSYAVDRVPGYMAADETARRTTGYVDFAFREDGEPLTVSGADLEIVTVDGRNVVFC